MLLLGLLFILYIIYFFSPAKTQISKRYQFLQNLHYFVNAENLHQLSKTEIIAEFEHQLQEFELEHRSHQLYIAFCKQLTTNVCIRFHSHAQTHCQFEQQVETLQTLFAHDEATAPIVTEILATYRKKNQLPIESGKKSHNSFTSRYSLN